MPTWNEIDALIEAQIAVGNSSALVCDQVRKGYLNGLSELTGRPCIAYYSGFLQKAPHPELTITDFDMNGFMANVHGLIPRNKGLDLIIHTPGGGIEATRAIVEYLYQMFSLDLRVIVPHMAMSAGTMIACASHTIVMGKHSNLGPTDPQVDGVAAIGVIEEIKRALVEIDREPIRQVFWSEVFKRYRPVFITDCERSIQNTKEMVSGWLAQNMFMADKDALDKAKTVVEHLTNLKETSEHGHHFLRSKCKEFGLTVVDLEDDQDLQEAVLSVHHSYIASFSRLRSIKFIENSNGASWNVSDI